MKTRIQARPRDVNEQQPQGAMLDVLYDASTVNGWREGMQAVTLALLGIRPGSAPLAPQSWGERPASQPSPASPRIGSRGADSQAGSPPSPPTLEETPASAQPSLPQDWGPGGRQPSPVSPRIGSRGADSPTGSPGLENVILEVGCGDGALLAALAAPGRTLIGLDLHLRAPAGSAVTFVQADAQRIPCADGSVDTLLALDVFDQQGVDLAVALAESHRVLAPGGILLLRVSAHGWLYGPHDAAFNSERRYSRAELLNALADAGFRVRRQTYANSLLAPLLILQRLLQRWRILPWNPAIYRAGWSNRLVAAALKAEARWLRRRNLRFGLSLIVIAEIKD